MHDVMITHNRRTVELLTLNDRKQHEEWIKTENRKERKKEQNEWHNGIEPKRSYIHNMEQVGSKPIKMCYSNNCKTSAKTVLFSSTRHTGW